MGTDLQSAERMNAHDVAIPAVCFVFPRLTGSALETVLPPVEPCALPSLRSQPLVMQVVRHRHLAGQAAPAPGFRRGRHEVRCHQVVPEGTRRLARLDMRAIAHRIVSVLRACAPVQILDAVVRWVVVAVKGVRFVIWRLTYEGQQDEAVNLRGGVHVVVADEGHPDVPVRDDRCTFEYPSWPPGPGSPPIARVEAETAHSAFRADFVSVLVSRDRTPSLNHACSLQRIDNFRVTDG